MVIISMYSFKTDDETIVLVKILSWLYRVFVIPSNR